MPADAPNNQPLKPTASRLHAAIQPASETDTATRNSAGSLTLVPSKAKRTSESDLSPSDLPIFSQDWWITIARGSSDYRELKIVDGDAVCGKLPFILSRHLGLFQAQDPHWSHLGGPIVDQRLGRNEQAKVLQQLLARFPKWYSGYFVCNPNISYADLVRDAFKRAGFQHSTETTYVRYPSDAPVATQRKSKHNGHIKRAGKKLDCVDIDANEFVRFFRGNLRARGKTSYAPLEIVARLTDEAVRRGQARAIAAKPRDFGATAKSDESSLYDAAIVYVWDHSHCYYWMSTCRPHFATNLYPKPHPDAIKFLAMHAIQHAQEMNLVFDADGVTTPGSEILYRDMFGLRKEQRRDVFQRTTALERFVRRVARRSKLWLRNPA
jgi:hypothetical protein